MKRIGTLYRTAVYEYSENYTFKVAGGSFLFRFELNAVGGSLAIRYNIVYLNYERKKPMKKFLTIIVFYIVAVIIITLIANTLNNKDLAGVILFLGTLGLLEVGLKNRYLLKE